MLISYTELINSCRVCRSPNQDGDYHCLFETANVHEEDTAVLSASGVLYEKLLDISLSQKNYYPKFLCNSCLLQMKLFLKLKDKALKTLEYLQSLCDEEPTKKENFNYNCDRVNGDLIVSNETQECEDVLNEYELNGCENEPNEYVESIVEELGTNAANDNIYENANYSFQKADEKLVLDNRLASDNSHNEVQLEPQSLYTEQHKSESNTTNIEINFKEDIKVQTNDLENKFLVETVCEEKLIQTPITEESFSPVKLAPILDKNDYVTEIYELIDDEERDIKETYDENYPEIVEEVDDSSSLPEVNTETGSTYNDVEYLLEEETDDLEDEANLAETRNAVKRRKLNKGTKRTKVYNCMSCKLEFTNLQLYKLHRIESHNENFTCTSCAREFKTTAALQKHIKCQHNNEPAFQCDICRKTFNQKVHFQYHMNHHNNIRNYKCDICEKAFIAKADLKTHLRLHTGERPYVCSVCGKDYLMMEHMKAHFITHTEQSFACDVCNKLFSTHKTLRLHVRTIHEDEPRFKCTFCLKPFRRKHHLEYHLKSHEKNTKNMEMKSKILNDEPCNLDDMVEEAIDDPGYIFLA